MKTSELSFKNDRTIKDALIKRMDQHIKMDELMQGATGSGGKGCTVWCALNNGDLQKGYNHGAFPEVLGLPEWLARLHDSIYEGLTVENSKWFSKQWVRAIPVGVNLEPVKYKFVAYLLQENLTRVLSLEIAEDLKKQVADAIRGSMAVNQTALNTGVWDETAAKSAESAARSAAWSAAESAAKSAESAAKSAESAAWSAAESAAESAAKSAESAARSAELAAESAAWSAELAAKSAAKSAESAAWSAAESAAKSAESAARSAELAAESAAWSAELAAESAAWSAELAAWSAELAAYKRYADELLRLFAECK